ncbi:MAG: hypothetical protein PUB76_07655 [Oscillospiraceae bacterium]|nr:hypothetical protein [Oscillospiraceae bacterium]
MRKFWGFYRNESYSIGCNGNIIYVYDKNEKEIAKFKDFPYAYTAAFMPQKNIIAVKSTEGILGFYNLDTLSLIKKITITRIGGQDEGFCFSADGKLFYNIEKPTCSVKLQLAVYETENFSKICTLFTEDIQMIIEYLEFDNETDTYYLLGYMCDDKNMFDHGFVAIFNTENQRLENIHYIERKQYEYLSNYKQWEMSGFTEKSLKWSPLKSLKQINSTSIKEIYELSHN